MDMGWAVCGSSFRSRTQEVNSDMKFTDTLGAISNLIDYLIEYDLIFMKPSKNYPRLHRFACVMDRDELLMMMHPGAKDKE